MEIQVKKEIKEFVLYILLKRIKVYKHKCQSRLISQVSYPAGHTEFLVGEVPYIL